MRPGARAYTEKRDSREYAPKQPCSPVVLAGEALCVTQLSFTKVETCGSECESGYSEGIPFTASWRYRLTKFAWYVSNMVPRCLLTKGAETVAKEADTAATYVRAVAQRLDLYRRVRCAHRDARGEPRQTVRNMRISE